MPLTPQVSRIQLSGNEAGAEFTTDVNGFPHLKVRNQTGVEIGSALASIGPDNSSLRVVEGPAFAVTVFDAEGNQVYP